MWFKKIIITIFICSIIFLFIKCESNDRYYRPDLPEQLCCIGIIDADDTISNSPFKPYTLPRNIRVISFEKSFQSEFIEELNDSLRNFRFSISHSGENILYYRSDSTIKNLDSYRIPTNIIFHPGEKYYLTASEKNTSDISAEATVPEPPPDIALISVGKETSPVSEFSECRRPFDDIIKFISLEISFNSNNSSYYALVLEGTGYNLSLPPDISGFLDFSIKESNTPGFFSVLPGLEMYHQTCINQEIFLDIDTVYSYFIDGNKIPDNKCNLTLLVKFNDGYSLFDVFTSLRLKLLSIPKELYLFEKSLYTYEKVADDPFSEPVYLNGNIKDGNGAFAVCRSSEFTVKF